MEPESEDVTVLLHAWRGGDAEAHDRLVRLLYDELRQIAHRHLRGEAQGHTINTTALVHEAYLEMVDSTGLGPRDRAHFLGAASQVMRHVLIDHARARKADKRGGDRVRIPLDDGIGAVGGWNPDLLDLDRALVRLAEHDEQMARVVECRFFGGMTLDETAEAQRISPRTVRRSWTRARAYLYRELEGC
jgi:RNA polymerase sigma factor (TIGR02999 family)